MPLHCSTDDAGQDAETEHITSRWRQALAATFWLSKRLVLGQVVSLAVSATGVFTTLLVNDNRSFPVFQSLTSYLWITVLFLPTYLFMLRRLRQEHGDVVSFRNFVPLTRLWRYPLVAIVDLEANYVVVKAYQYTDMTSVQLLDCFTIPFVMVLSYVFLRVRYTRFHACGAGIAIIGLGLLIGLDADGLNRTASAPNPLLGDMLCLVSSALYAISNVACEKLIKLNEPSVAHTEGEGVAPHVAADIPSTLETTSETMPPRVSTPLSPSQPPLPSTYDTLSATTDNSLQDAPDWLPVLEYLACMPPCGLCFAIIQLMIVEWPSLHASFQEGWSNEDMVYQGVFGLSMVFVYSGMPILFYYSSATFANLSLLTADVYSIIWNVTIFGIRPRWEFFLAYLVIVAGIVIFDTKGLEKLRRRLYRLLPS